ncbi:hypothetical protein [Methylocystis sp. SB2]|uniref:hypothetical protein n=1 Tax=Methylocystis sp. (strain SB2) TaxID=743836 RepID=UPI0012EE0CDF|nr:hypothetical protein [Methylocystis sp. SB2]ULO25118.1 hypothetical protein LNB28_06940 [Methylocystis sp. SB2]
MSPEQRQLISIATRERMAAPEVRRKISEATKRGIAARAEWAPELVALRAAWLSAGPDARRRFLDELLEPLHCAHLCAVSSNQGRAE